MHQRFDIGVDADHPPDVGIVGAAGVGLADESRSQGNQQIGVLHRVIAAEAALRTADGHVAGMMVRDDAGDQRAGDRHAVGQVEKLGDFAACARAPPPTRTTTRDASASACGRSAIALLARRRAQRRRSTDRQLIQVELGQQTALRVHRQHEKERPGAVADGRPCSVPIARPMPTASGVCRQYALPHGLAETQEQLLLGLGDLLHVRAFVVGGLVAEQIPHAQPVRCRRQRSREGVQGARADRSEHGGLFAGHPAECRRGMGRLCLRDARRRCAPLPASS